MAIEIEYLGSWVRYEPEERPAGAPSSALFAKRESDGVDWYEFARNPENFPEGALLATAQPVVGGYRVQAVTRDRSTLFPAGGVLAQITGADPEDPKPWAPFEGRRYDPEAGTIEDWPPPNVDSVTAAQAKIQLLRTKTEDGSNLLAKVKEIVSASGDEELQLWFEGAGTWLLKDPNVQSLGAGLGVGPERIQALFNEASKIGA